MSKQLSVVQQVTSRRNGCEACGNVKEVQRVQVPGKGGCGDSFCWAGCEMVSCKGFTARLCNACAITLRREEG